MMLEEDYKGLGEVSDKLGLKIVKEWMINVIISMHKCKKRSKTESTSEVLRKVRKIYAVCSSANGQSTQND